MLSTITRAKHLCLVAQCITKTELMTSLPNAKIRKVFFTLCSTQNQRSRLEDLQDSNKHELLGGKSKENTFGKIFSLDLEPVEDEENVFEKEAVNAKNKKRRKKNIDLKKVDANKPELDNSVESDHNQETNIEKNKRNLKYDMNSETFLKIMNSLATSKLRKKENKIILEGKRLIYEGIAAGYKPLYIFFSRLSDIENFNLTDETKLCKIPYKTLQLRSNLVTSQGVIGVFKTPAPVENPDDLNTIPLTVICDNVRDSGNMGSILRILAGVGCQRAILTKGCVDIWEPKVIRAAAGAHFHLPIYQSKVWTDIESMVPEDNQIFLADSNYLARIEDSEGDEDMGSERGSLFKTESLNCDDIPLLSYHSVEYWKNNVTIVLGGETHGLSEESIEFVRKRQGFRVYIPTSKKVESLNNAMALGILSFEVKRQFDTMTKESQTEIEGKVLSEETA